MKHRVKTKRFNRDTKSRKALLRNSLRGLIEHGHIETNESRAKEVRRIADKLIATAQKGDLKARRQLHRYFGKRDVVNTLVDQVVPALGDRQSGFCSLEKISNRRGDNVTIYRLSLLVKEKTWTSLNTDKKSEAKAETAKRSSGTTRVSKTASKAKLEKKAAPAKKAPAKKTTKKAAPKASKKESK